MEQLYTLDENSEEDKALLDTFFGTDKYQTAMCFDAAVLLDRDNQIVLALIGAKDDEEGELIPTRIGDCTAMNVDVARKLRDNLNELIEFVDRNTH